ncbi:MAG: hypothetical protein JSW66_12195, partial [Phycisphaerales bacterium]
PMDWRIEYEERAAILEYDGGLTREEAEVQALREINARLKNAKKRWKTLCLVFAKHLNSMYN